jgi:hypothetical protein
MMNELDDLVRKDELDDLVRKEMFIEFMEDNYYPITPPWWMVFIPILFLAIPVLMIYLLVMSFI